MATATATQPSEATRGRPAAAIARFGLVAAALAVAFVASRSTLGNVLAPRRPLVATAIDPSNARAAAGAAQARIARGERADSPAVRALVRSALLRDVTVPAAIEVRAIDLQSNRRPDAAAALVAASLEISRRSLGTHLWLIQRSVENGNTNAALAEFDRALRTSSRAPQLLFPVLARATVDPPLREPLARLLDRPSDWREKFLDYAIGDPGRTSTVAPVVLQMRDTEFLKAAQVDRKLVAALVAGDAFAEAKQVELRFGPPTANGALLRDGRFAEPRFTYPFGWGLFDSAETWAARERSAGIPRLAYRGLAGTTGQVARQLLMLSPGAYRLRATSASAPSDPGALPYWTVTCGGKAPTQIARTDQPASGGSAEVDFTVPPACPGQWLAFNLRASDRVDGQAGALASVAIEPLP